MKDKVFLILGGDNRSLYLGEYLENQGFNVCYYAFNHTDCFNDLASAISGADFIILPLPFSRDRITLNAPLFDETVLVSDICALVTPQKYVFGGQLSKSVCEGFDSAGIPYTDFFRLEELAVYNAVPTAEGVVGLLTEKLPITIHGMKCAITGYGKVGKAVAKTLKALGAEITVFARKEQDIADAYSNSYKSGYISSLSDTTEAFDVLINTVPAKIIGKNQLSRLNPDCLVIELASAPFGIDFQVAKELAIDVIKASSLPGKVAPKTAGEIIGRSILPIIRARGSTD